MKTIGITKNADNAGRLGIPAEKRERLGLYGKVELIMTDEGCLYENTRRRKMWKSKKISANVDKTHAPCYN